MSPAVSLFIKFCSVATGLFFRLGHKQESLLRVALVLSQSFLKVLSHATHHLLKILRNSLLNFTLEFNLFRFLFKIRGYSFRNFLKALASKFFDLFTYSFLFLLLNFLHFVFHNYSRVLIHLQNQNPDNFEDVVLVRQPLFDGLV